jgi:ligand-binding sensor domain-containing protein
VGNGVTDPYILSLAVTRDGTLYAGTFRGGIFRSRDEGKTWQPVNAGLKHLEIKALMAVDEELYAGTSDGVYRLHGSEDRWSVVTTGLDDVLVHALARSSDGTLYAGTSGKGILRFKRHSTGWVRLQHGLKNHEGMIENFIRVIVVDQEQGILAGTFDGGVFHSADGGLTWRGISRALPNDSIRGIALRNEGVIVATGNGIFKTTDKGKQWVPVNKGLTSPAVQALLAAGDGSLYVGTSAGVFRSDDGLTWIAVNQGLEVGMTPPPFLFR